MRLLLALDYTTKPSCFLLFHSPLKSSFSHDRLNIMAHAFLCQRLNIPGMPSPIEGPSEITNKFPNLGAIVNEALKYLFPLAGLLLFINLILGGFQYLVSGGDQKAMSAAQGRITNSIIGFVILFVAYFIVQIFGFIFKLPTF